MTAYSFDVVVIPAEAGIQLAYNSALPTKPIVVPLRGCLNIVWVSAFAGTTKL